MHWGTPRLLLQFSSSSDVILVSALFLFFFTFGQRVFVKCVAYTVAVLILVSTVLVRGTIRFLREMSCSLPVGIVTAVAVHLKVS